VAAICSVSAGVFAAKTQPIVFWFLLQISVQEGGAEAAQQCPMQVAAGH
jgi:hypothetical protein